MMAMPGDRHPARPAVPWGSPAFFSWLKRASEAHWETIQPDPVIYGFQVQPGTKWNPGLDDRTIQQYERDMGFAFPPVFKDYLRVMNGTDTPAINIYGSSGVPHARAPAYYAYPADLEVVKDMIAWVYEENDTSEAEVIREGYPHVMPIVSHRFLVMDGCTGNPVLSMHGNDIIPYAVDLQHFLAGEILGLHDPGVDARTGPGTGVPFWG